MKYSNEPYIKICGNGERFWAKVINHDTVSRIYEARVDNDLVGKHAFKFGDTFLIKTFNIRHINSLHFNYFNGHLNKNNHKYISVKR